MHADAQHMEEINRHRAAIDELDLQIVALLNKRQEHALAIRSIKPAASLALFDARREEEIIEMAQAYSKGPLYPENIREIFTTILKVSKEVPE